MRRRASAVLVAAALILLAGGCGGEGGSGARSAKPYVVGFIYVGRFDDVGYNAAAHAAALAVGRLPGVKVLEVQDVPETAAAEPVMQRLIARGARVVVATSFGHLTATLNVAAANPGVTFLHQGGLQTAPNVGTYFGTSWEAEYAAGQAAGLTSRSGRLGFVAAFPIAQSLLTINAFALGAQSVNPRAVTRVLFTSAWCDPPRQRAAARRLLAWGADVFAQHQDCTGAVVREARRGGAWAVGYHADGRRPAGPAWLTGAVWHWGPLLQDAIRTIRAGRFAGSRFDGRLRATARDGVVGLAPFGSRVPARVAARARATFAAIRAGRLRPFDGPVRDQRGRVRIAGRQPSVAELEETSYLVRGVVGRVRAR